MKIKLLLILHISTAFSKIYYQDCVKNNGKNVTNFICIPEDYGNDDLPQNPMLLTSTIFFNRVQEVDEDSMSIAFSLWYNVHWTDPGKD